MSDRREDTPAGDPAAGDAGGDFGSSQGGDLGAFVDPEGRREDAQLSVEEAREALGGTEDTGATERDGDSPPSG